MAHPPGVEIVELAGVPIASLSRDAVVRIVGDALRAGRGGWVITTNVDHLKRCQSDRALAALYHEADLVVADGMPLLWATRLRRTPLPDRVAGSDLVGLLAADAAEAGRSLYLLGGAPGAAEAAAAQLSRTIPELRLAGWSCPLVDPIPSDAQVDAVARELQKASPDLVYVALGAPKQEWLIHRLRERFPSTWWMGVGISLSFIANHVARAPAWMQRSGLEWLHRLSQEPERLAKRYLLDDLPFAAMLLARSLRERGRTRRRSTGRS